MVQEYRRRTHAKQHKDANSKGVCVKMFARCCHFTQRPLKFTKLWKSHGFKVPLVPWSAPERMDEFYLPKLVLELELQFGQLGR